MTWEEVIELLKTSENAEEINSKRYEIAEWMPEIIEMFNFDQENNYHQYDLWLHSVHTVLGIDKSIDDDMLYLSALLHDIGKIYSRCRSNRPGDINCHYYGHPEKSVQIVKDILRSLLIKGVNFSEKDEERLLYYIKYHDDRISLKIKHLKRHLKIVDVETFKKLMELQIADAKAHVILPAVQERIDICSEWKNGRADELKEIIKELGSNETVQKIGIPQYKMGEMVMFYYDNGKEKKEECGRISIIDRFGTFGQTREVSYDIESVDRILYKHIPESDVFGFQEVKGDYSDRT